MLMGAGILIDFRSCITYIHNQIVSPSIHLLHRFLIIFLISKLFSGAKNKRKRFRITTACYLPARYIFGIMAMLGVMVAYIMRACLSIAITQMVVYIPHNESSGGVDEEVCPAADYVSSSPNLRKVW